MKGTTISHLFFFLRKTLASSLMRQKIRMKEKYIFAEVLSKFDRRNVLVGNEKKTYTITSHHQCYLQKAWSRINLWRSWKLLELQHEEHMGKPK